MTKLLILGSEGYLGTVLVPFLSKNNYEIVGVDQCFFGKKNKNSKKIKIIKKNYINLKKDFLEKFDYVIDLVNISNDPASELNRKFTYKVNYLNKLNLYKKLSKSKNLKRYVYMSSCSVYGNNKNLITEKSLPKPISLYSKLCLKYEKYLKLKKKIPFSILRLGTLYGWSKRMRYDVAINKIIRDMIFLKKVEVLGGNQLRFFCYNKFACKIIDSIIKDSTNRYKNKILNIGVFNTNIIKLIDKILKIIKIKNINVVHEKYTIDKRSYEVSLRTVKKMYLNLNFKNLVKDSIHETYLKIKNDKKPFDRNKITLNIYKDYLDLKK